MGALVKVKKKAKQKGAVAAGTAAASAVLIAVGAWPLGLIGLGVSSWATWDWFKYRAKNGLRF